jgi:hypothetical protein
VEEEAHYTALQWHSLAVESSRRRENLREISSDEAILPELTIAIVIVAVR